MNIEQRRRLTELYARGELINLAPEGQEPWNVWIRKMTPADAEVSYLKAGARRASLLALEKEDPPSDLYLMLKGEVEAMSHEQLILWVSSQDLLETRTLTEARIAGEDEWAKERYLISLQERFTEDSFQKKLTSTPDDPEVVRILGELNRYQTAVENEMVELTKVAELDAERMSEEELGKEVMKYMLTAHADAAWLAEFQRCQIWRCCFEGDSHTTPIFDTRDEVEMVQVEFLNKLKEVIDRIHVGDQEGKDLQQIQDSLLLSA